MKNTLRLGLIVKTNENKDGIIEEINHDSIKVHFKSINKTIEYKYRGGSFYYKDCCLGIKPVILYVYEETLLTTFPLDGILRTSKEWQSLFPETRILDPDGWDRTNFQFSWEEEKIPFIEYQKRLNESTIMASINCCDKTIKSK